MRSKIWRYYDEQKNDGIKVGLCRLCDPRAVIKCKGGSTKGLWTHLQTNHNKEYESIRKTTPNNSSSISSKQPILKEVLANQAKYKADHFNQVAFDKLMEDLFVKDGVPFRLSKSETFLKIVKLLDKRISVKSPWTYSMKMRKKKSYFKKWMSKFIRKEATAGAGLTTDLWDSRSQESFLSLTIHFITRDFKLVRATPAIKIFGNKRHLAENISKKVGDEIQSLKLPPSRPAVLVSDSASNMVSMKKALVEQGIIRDDLPCVAHKVQNAVKETMNKRGMKPIAEKAKGLVKFIRQGLHSHCILQKNCKRTDSGVMFFMLKSHLNLLGIVKSWSF